MVELNFEKRKKMQEQIDGFCFAEQKKTKSFILFRNSKIKTKTSKKKDGESRTDYNRNHYDELAVDDFTFLVDVAEDLWALARYS
jgi:hypothetical protein